MQWCCVDCLRVRTVFTGRCKRNAASAVCPWIVISSFAPNAPPLAASSTFHFFQRQLQDVGNHLVVVRRALTLRVEFNSVAFRHGQASFRFEKRRFDRLRRPRLLDDMRGLSEGRFHIAARKGGGIENIVMHPQIAGGMHLRRAGFHRGKRIGDRFEHRVIDFYFVGGLARVEGGVRDHHGQKISNTTRGFADRNKNRQVRIIEARAALSGNVGGGENPHDSRHGQSGRHVNRIDFGSRVFAEHHSAVQHPRNAHVVDERPLTESLFKAAIAGRGVADPESISISLAVPVSVLPVCILRVAAHSEIFAEIGMAAGFLARQLSTVLPGFTSGLNGVNDPCVAGAAAEMPGEPLLYSLAIIRAALPQHGSGANHDARDTEAALHSAFVHERFAQHLPHIFRDAFERDHIVAFHLFRFPQARQGWPPIHQDRAAAARALGSAAILGRNDAALLAQNFEEVHPRLIGARGAFPV